MVGPMSKETERLAALLLKCADGAAAVFCIFAAYWLRFSVLQGQAGALGLGHYLRLLAVAIPVELVLYHWLDLYDLFRYRPLAAVWGKVAAAGLCNVGVLFLVSFLTHQDDISRLTLGLFGLCTALATGGVRTGIQLALRRRRRRGALRTRVLIAGWNGMTAAYLDKITEEAALGYQVLGYLRDTPADTQGRQVPWLGKLEQVAELLRQGGVDEVVIALDGDEFRRLGGLAEACAWEGVRASLLPFYAQYLPTNLYVEDLDGLPLLNLHRIPLDNPLNALVKRAFDLAGAAALLVLCSPVMAAAALGIRLSSPGPVIYRQQRVGRNRKLFTLYKFRSMRVEGNADATTWGTRQDSRRTRFGALLRKLSIDELPQLVNVLKGEMSLVGPRPERPYFVEKFRDEVPLYMRKHRVRPGITGWAQVNGWRGDTSILERIKCDLYYIENWSLALDIKILFLTLVRGVVNPSEQLTPGKD